MFLWSTSSQVKVVIASQNVKGTERHRCLFLNLLSPFYYLLTVLERFKIQPFLLLFGRLGLIRHSLRSRRVWDSESRLKQTSGIIAILYGIQCRPSSPHPDFTSTDWCLCNNQSAQYNAGCNYISPDAP